MRITFVGTSHGIPESDRFCSAAFIEVGGALYIIDAGAPISPLILKYGYRHEDVRGIFITHLHSDHFVGILEYCTQISWYYRSSSPDIFVPEQRGCSLIRNWVHGILESDNDDLKLHVYENGPVFRDNNVEISAVSTGHTKNSHAFRINAEGKKVLFSGDMSTNFPELPGLLGGEHYDLVTCESAHTVMLADCADTLKSVDADKMVINHINPQKLEGIEVLAGTLPFDLTVSYDGLIMDI